MRIRRRAACRADGRLYCQVRINGADNPTFTAEVDDCPVPVEAYPYESGDWLLVLPFLASETLRVTAHDERGNTQAIVFRCPVERWLSSLTYRLRPDIPSALRGYERSWVHHRFRPSLDRYLRGENGWDVWRVSVTWEGSSSCDPTLSFLDGSGRPLSLEVFPFERQGCVRTEWGGTVNRCFYSVKVPDDLRELVVMAHDAGGCLGDGFCSLDERLYRDKEHESWLFMRDARADDESYRQWFEEHRAQRGDLDAQRCALPNGPTISLVVPCFKSDRDYLAELVESVRGQSYARWELLLVDASPDSPVVRELTDGCDDNRIRRIPLEGNRGIAFITNAGVAEATGDYVAFLDHGDLLEPDALFWYARTAVDKQMPGVLYCDEDLFSERGAWRQPIFKTALNVDLLYSHSCVMHLLCVARAVLKKIGPPPREVDGAQDYDLTLRALAGGARFEHIPRVLYHWRECENSTGNAPSKPYGQEAGRLALERHLAQRGISATVGETESPFVYRVRYDLPSPHPLVSVVIPSRDHADMLCSCVESIFGKTTYDRLEVVVVENSSREPETFALYEELSAAHPNAFRVVDASDEVAEGFNYSRLVNYGAKSSKGEYLLLLNNDTEVISPDFIEEMLGYLQRPEVGVVGAKLYFRDGLTQHAGVLVGPYGAVAHPNQDFPRSREGYLSRAVRPGNFSAVTGACQMVKRSVFDEVGGYDERLAVGFNDIDFCFRVREAGRLVVFTPYAELFHYEFVSRGREEADVAKLARWKREQALFTERWPGVFVEGDPYTNPNLDRNSFYYGL